MKTPQPRLGFFVSRLSHLFVLGAALLFSLPTPGQGKAVAPLTASLDLASTPTAGGQATVIWTGLPKITPDRAEIVFQVTGPAGAAPAGATRALRLEAGRTAAATYAFATPLPGIYTVMATANMSLSGARISKSEALRLNVPASGPARLEKERPVSAAEYQGRVKARAPRAAAAPPPAFVNFAGFTVSGTLQYTNKIFDPLNLTVSTAPAPVRRARIEIRDVQGSSSRLLGTTRTDNAGRFSLALASNNDGDGTGYDIFVRVVADGPEARVTDQSNVLYAYDAQNGAWLNWGGGNLNAGTITIGLDFSGPWNIFDSMLTAYDFVKSLGVTPGQAQAAWEAGQTPPTSNITHFDPSTKIIYVEGQADDPDEFDDAVLIHEYGHFMEYTQGFTKNPGGLHELGQIEDPALAWSEGWSTFFSSAARANQYYIDSNSTDITKVDLEQPPALFDGGERYEISVSAALWDIFDSHNDGADILSDGMPHIWPIFHTYFNSSRACVFRDFYNGWVAYAYPSLTAVQAILGMHKINYGWTTAPVLLTFSVNAGAATATSRKVTLNNACSGTVNYYMASESPGFSGAIWNAYATAPPFTLTTPGNGVKTVYLKLRNTSGQVSSVMSDTITLNEPPPAPPQVSNFAINGGAASTGSYSVTLNHAMKGVPRYYMASESRFFSGAIWIPYTANPTFTLSAPAAGVKTVYFKVRDYYNQVSNVVSDTIVMGPVVTSFAINNGAAATANRTVTLNNVCAGNPAYYVASEFANFSDAYWTQYSTAPSFSIKSAGNGVKTVYMRIKDATGAISTVKSDTITLNESAPLTLGVAVSGNIASGADYDLYNFIVPTAGWYTVESTAGTLGDGYMALLDSTGKTVDEADNQASNQMPMICKNLAAGTYTIVFEGYSTQDTGGYTIRVRAGSVYVPLTLDSATKAPGNITSSSDVDWFSFTVSRQDVYTLRANGGGTLGAANMYLYMDGDPQPLTWNEGENPANNKPMPMITCALDPGTYYVAVEGHGLSDLGTYTMEFLPVTKAASTYTTLIDNWLGVYGYIASQTDENYYTFVVPPDMNNNTYTLRTSPGNLTGVTNLTKGHMYLYNPSGALIAESTGTEPGANQKMPYIQKKLPAGTYYVVFIGNTTADLGYYGIELLRTNP